MVMYQASKNMSLLLTAQDSFVPNETCSIRELGKFSGAEGVIVTNHLVPPLLKTRTKSNPSSYAFRFKPALITASTIVTSYIDVHQSLFMLNQIKNVNINFRITVHLLKSFKTLHGWSSVDCAKTYNQLNS
jgi:hypothetical protein